MTVAPSYIRNPDTGGLYTVATLPAAGSYPPSTAILTSDGGYQVSNGNTWQPVEEVAAYSAGNTSTAPVPDLSKGATQAWTQNGSVTWGAPINPGYVGQVLTLIVTKDASATSRTTAFNAAYRDAPTIAATTTSGAIALWVFEYTGISWQYLGGSTVFA